MTKQEADSAKARCDAPSGPIYTMDTRAALAARAVLVEALKPFGKRGNSACAKYPEERAAYELLKAMGELE